MDRLSRGITDLILELSQTHRWLTLAHTDSIKLGIFLRVGDILQESIGTFIQYTEYTFFEHPLDNQQPMGKCLIVDENKSTIVDRWYGTIRGNILRLQCLLELRLSIILASIVGMQRISIMCVVYAQRLELGNAFGRNSAAYSIKPEHRQWREFWYTISL